MSLQVQTITTEAGLRQLAPEWEILAATMEPWTPFITPTWNLIHWAHFRRNGLAERDVLNVYAVRDAAGNLVAVAPMQMTSRPGYGPLQLRQLHYFGADPNITEVRGIICRPEHEQAAMAALAAQFHAGDGSWDWLHWGGLRQGGEGHAVMVGHAPATVERTLAYFYVELPESFEALRARLSRNAKDAIRKCYNSLKRDGHAFTLEVITEPADVANTLTTFFQLHTARADADYGIAHGNVFATGVAQAFLRDYAQRSAERGELRIFQLRVADTIVAMRIGFCAGDDLYLYYSGHLPAWGKYSVMTTTVAEALKWAIEAGFKRVNLSAGSDKSKLRWLPTETRLWESFQAAPTWRGQLMTHMFTRKKNAQSASVGASWQPPGQQAQQAQQAEPV